VQGNGTWDRAAAVETIGGITFEDPCSWLEQESPETLSWQEQQDARTLQQLSSWRALPRLHRQVSAQAGTSFLFAPVRRGRHWFRLAFAEGGARIEVADRPVGQARVLVDPAALATEAEHAELDWFYPSPDGRYVAFGVSQHGDEQSVLHVINTETENILPERFPFTSIATVAWLPDSTGFYYNAGQAPDWIDSEKRIFFHRLGERRQSEAEPITVREAYCVFPQVSPNGRWLAAVTGEMDPRADFIKELPGGKWRPFLFGIQGRGYGTFAGDNYVAIMTEGTPAGRGRLVSIPVATCHDRSTWKELMPAGQAVIISVELVGQYLIVCELVNAYAQLKVLALDGRVVEVVGLPERGAVLQTSLTGHYMTALPSLGMNISTGEQEFTFTFSTFTRSPALYRYDLREFRLEELVPPVLEHGHLLVHEATAHAPDGKVVQYHIIHRADAGLRHPPPALIYGYGGFNTAFIPGYLGTFLPYIEAGGVFVFAHLRGGGEFGADFWADGRGAAKQHTYDDLYAVAEDLANRGVSDPGRLGVIGASNGGLLAAVAVTQRPELWRAGCSLVPVADLLKFTRDSYTANCVHEYGDPADPGQARVLYSYSPCHNVRDGERYPATLIYGGAHDMRCPPWHARKLAARLQSASTSGHPVLLRVAAEGGHLTVMNDTSQVTEWLGFLMRELGLEPN
jgi:prolyl oligopeptidase